MVRMCHLKQQEINYFNCKKINGMEENSGDDFEFPFNC